MDINGLALLTRHIDTIITSSRDPSPRLRNFLNDLEAIIPNSVKYNRGKLNLETLLNKAKNLGSKYLILVEAYKGNPSRILVYNLISNYLKYTFNLKGVSTLSDFGIKRNRIKGKGCLRKIECKEFIQFFIDINLITLHENECAYYIDVIRKSEYCEISFKDKFQKYVGPIIRVNDFNINIIREGK